MPDPRFLDGTIDLAALEHGGDVVDCSNTFYSSPVQLLLPGRATIMGDGWENARRRDGGNDHVTIRLAARGQVRRVEIDTSYFVGNAAGWASLRGTEADHPDEDEEWFDLVPKTRLQPDTRHFLRSVSAMPVTHVRLDVFPDGGLARLRVHGELVADAHWAAVLRWLDLLPAEHAVQVLRGAGVPRQSAEEFLRQRPFADGDVLPAAVLSAFLGELR
ncbi:hypothetical protein ACQP25_29780 [Microtetraspora malaysiensis]|uniref:hypothetical protein n=1 Tax=Microtetraspora malaysiensis TaxID=161358 RepID=UPI003D8C5D64